MTQEERSYFSDAYHFLDKFCDVPDLPMVTKEAQEWWMDVHREMIELSNKHKSNSFMNELLLSVFSYIEHLYYGQLENRTKAA